MMSASLFAGKTIAFTGEFAGATRVQMTRIAQAAGATVTSTVNGNTNVLVCGKGHNGVKAGTAVNLGVTMLSQPQFARFTKNVQVAAPAPVAAVPQYQAAAPMAAPGQIQYPTEYMAMAKAPRARRPATAAPMTYAAPVQTYAAPAPIAVAPAAPVAFTNQAVSLPGQTVAFTGTLETAAREEAAAMAAQAGAHVSSAITPSTNFLVVGATPGLTKLNSAQAMGVRNISEEQFMKAALPAVNAMPEVAAPMAYAAPVQTYAAPAVQTYAAPMVRAPRAKKVAAFQAPAQAYAAPVVEAPMTYEAPMGSMPWETEAVAAAPVQTYTAPVQAYAAPVVRAPRAKKVAFQAPAQTYAAPVQTYAAPAPVAAAPVAQTGAVHLAGQNVVFTGALQVNRVVAAAMATKCGAMSATGSLSTKTNLLVCGANAGEKMAKAQSMGVRCISEAEFVAACRN